MLAALDEAGREEAWEEIESELRQFEGADGFAGPCELIVCGRDSLMARDELLVSGKRRSPTPKGDERHERVWTTYRDDDDRRPGGQHDADRW